MLNKWNMLKTDLVTELQLLVSFLIRSHWWSVFFFFFIGVDNSIVPGYWCKIRYRYDINIVSQGPQRCSWLAQTYHVFLIVQNVIKFSYKRKCKHIALCFCAFVAETLLTHMADMKRKISIMSCCFCGNPKQQGKQTDVTSSSVSTFHLCFHSCLMTGCHGNNWPDTSEPEASFNRTTSVAYHIYTRF